MTVGGMTITEFCDLLQQSLMDNDMEDLPVYVDRPGAGPMPLSEAAVTVAKEDGQTVVVIR